jgi:excinuclease ABC subunit C
MTTEDFKKIYYDSIPDEPGIYKYISDDDTILYVGKAKNLKKRLSSYFTKSHDSYKTKLLIKNAERIEYTVVHTEQDALLLESTLIKKHQPRYNVMLKDGKSYAYIRIRNEAFPRVEFTRRVFRDGSHYFGPYTSKHRANVLLGLIKNLFQLRTCKLNLSEKNIHSGKFNVCLEYHIKNCKGACVGKESPAEYEMTINQIKNILKGNFKTVRDYIHERMEHFASTTEFEMAQVWKEKLDALTDYQSKSTVVSPKLHDLDIFSIDMDEKTAYVNYIKIVDGSIIHADTVEVTKNLTDDKKDILRYTIGEMREKYRSIAQEIIIPFSLLLPDPSIKTTVPKIGDKKQLLEMSEKNTKFYLLQKKKQQASKTKKQTSAERILRTMQEDLQLDGIPFHIECFDNSNLQGNQPVASCVVFKNAIPSKKDYRHFNIKTVSGINDFASMEEIVFRRYSRLLKEEQPLPQLVVIDGGKGQLSAAMNSIRKLDLQNEIAVIGIAKRLEEIYYPDDPVPLHINKKSESLKLIQQARNEAHRFAITFHRQKRSKEFIHTGLIEIKGVGAKSIQKLLREFKSVERIKNATEEDIAIVVGKSVAGRIKDYLKDN